MTREVILVPKDHSIILENFKISNLRACRLFYGNVDLCKEMRIKYNM